ncbi:hypothetical protein AB0D15_30040, partial [Streptomyces sp. NPDC048551]
MSRRFAIRLLGALGAAAGPLFGATGCVATVPPGALPRTPAPAAGKAAGGIRVVQGPGGDVVDGGVRRDGEGDADDA